ncbi:hypothetical protein FEM48_Zijuj07G0041100 [Ziziphus jujuba var. spinosa]|uniref:NB-ARC domain-containing protein n=1 Tax=Ziziphus jujuba var. spinosa TaxID=714518 RepID=A0A978V2C7_ZIZJJ|nr:hypothetical protein FEM48_Zijuj07G0041100 [Ziziphus jujuba var. spinosa]
MADLIITPVIENSIKLLQYEINLLSGVKDQVSTLQYDLRIMNAFLKDSAGKDNKRYLVKEVIDQTNEIGLEAEDIIDTYIAIAIKKRRMNRMAKLYHGFRKPKTLHHLANKTTRVKDLIRSINENKSAYGITEVESSSFDAAAAQLVRRKRINVEEDDVVGFDNQTNDLVNRLTHPQTSQLDVISKEMSLEDPLKTSVEDLQAKIRQYLSEKRYFVVMDDVWNPEVWEEVRKAFPDDNNRSRILLTSREKQAASAASSTLPFELKPLDEDRSWDLLCKKVFRGEPCPTDMVVGGRKLAESCKGLPLSIVVLAGILVNKERSAQVWSDILDAKVNSFLMEDGIPCLDILALSSVTENFYEVHSQDKLSSRSKRARRLSIHHNELSEYISTTDAYDQTTSSSSSSLSSARSLLFFSQAKSLIIQEEDWVCVCQRFKFIRVLLLFDARLSSESSIPKQIEELIYLKYLGIKFKKRYSESENRLNPIRIPDSICNLQFLETIDIRACVLWPKNIWRMKQLRRLYARPMKFPDSPSHQKAEFCNLQVLSNLLVDPQTANYIKESKFPNLSQLGLYYDGDPKEDNMNVSVMTEILISTSKFKHLRRLLLHGFPKSEPSFKTFPSTINKLTLYMSFVDYNLVKILKRLPSLNVLKIDSLEVGSFKRLYVCAGDFPQLQVLRMESFNLETWEMESNAMPKLQRLVLSCPYGLKALPDELWRMRELKHVELLDPSDELTKSLNNSTFFGSHGQLNQSGKHSSSFFMTNGCHVLIDSLY